MPAAPESAGPGGAGFFAARWHGSADTGTVFWRDMIAVGTLVNILASFLALMLAAQDAPTALVLTVHFAPLPYNLLLVMAIWRSPRRPAWMLLAASGWLALMTVI